MRPAPFQPVKTQEIRLTQGRMRLAAKRWGNPEGLPVLALHGWLDNAASFDALLPHLDLQRYQVVALDLPGHGKSQHRPAGDCYALVDNVVDILDALEALGWKQFTLLGHSLGGVLSMLTAAAYPERVQRLVVIDAVGPLASPEDETPKQIRKGVDRYLQGRGKAVVYASLDEAAKARQNGVSALSKEAAAIIAKRNLKRVPGGYSWRTDSRLRWPSLMRLSEAQVLACLRAVSCPTLLIAAKQGFINPENPVIKQRLAQIADLRLALLDGGHHLHLEPHPEQSAALINEYLAGWTPTA